MLKCVFIQNFKSLKKVEIELQKVNLLIGPNNSGKTNFLKALEYVGKEVVPHASEPNRDNYGYKHDTRSNIDIQLKYDIEVSRHNLPYDFTTSDAEYVVLGCTINTNASVSRSVWEQSRQRPSIITNPVHDKDFLSEFFSRSIKYIEIYKPDTNKLDKPGPIGTGEELVSADASNLVSFLDLMGIKYRRTVFNQIETDLQKCVPEFVEIKLEDVKRTEELIKLYDKDKSNNSFRRLGLADGKQGITYWSDELSEGTLYFLALLCIINQPNPPKLLLLEEPEKGIHPRRIWEVMKFIFQLAEEKDVQIIMTTHNEHVVNAFSSMPESVFVFDKDEETGATTVKNLQKDIIEPSHQASEKSDTKKIDFTSDLGEKWMYGLIGGVPADEL